MPKGRKKVFKNSSIPESIEKRQLLEKYLEEIVGYLSEIDRQKIYIKDVRQSLVDSEGKFNLDPKYVSRLIKVAYDKFKISKQINELQETIEEYNVLKGNKSED